MPRPPNRERQLTHRLIWLALLIVLGIYLLGELQLWLTPPTALDAKCLNRSLAEMRGCIIGR